MGHLNKMTNNQAKLISNNAMSSEMKLGLNLAKGAVTVLKTDTAPQLILKNSIREVDSLLRIGDEKLIDKCHRELTVKYRSIFCGPGGRFYLVPFEVYDKLSFVDKWALLKSMGDELYRVLIIGKIAQGVKEFGKAGLEYAVDEMVGR